MMARQRGSSRETSADVNESAYGQDPLPAVQPPDVVIEIVAADRSEASRLAAIQAAVVEEVLTWMANHSAARRQTR